MARPKKNAESLQPWVVRDVPESVRHRVRVYAAQHDMTMAQAVEKLVGLALSIDAQLPADPIEVAPTQPEPTAEVIDQGTSLSIRIGNLLNRGTGELSVITLQVYDADLIKWYRQRYMGVTQLSLSSDYDIQYLLGRLYNAIGRHTSVPEEKELRQWLKDERAAEAKPDKA